MMKVTISGTYKSGKDLVDYKDVVIELPNIKKELIDYIIQNRYLARVFEGKAKRFDMNDRCYVDKIENDDKIEHKLSGKSIKDLSAAELQEFASYFELTEIPLYRQTGLSEAQRVAYRAYCNKFLNTEYGASYDYNQAPDVKVPSCVEPETGKIKGSKEPTIFTDKV